MSSSKIKALIVLGSVLLTLALRIIVSIGASESSALATANTLRRLVVGSALACSSVFALLKLMAEQRKDAALLEPLSYISDYLLYFLLSTVLSFFFFSLFPVR